MTLKISAATLGTGFRYPEIQVEPGQVHLLRGANGSGKTTLLRMISGLIPGSSVTVNGKALDSLTPRGRLRAGLCAAASDDPVFGPLSLQSQLQLAAWPIPKKEQKTRIKTALASWGLPADARGEHLSGGEQLRFVFARIQLLSPPAIVIDEPYRHADRETKERIEETIMLWAAAGTAVLLLVHPETEVAHVDTRYDLVG